MSIAHLSRKRHLEVVEDRAQTLDLDASYRYCEALSQSRHKNFPVASFFAPSRLRKHIWAVYAFAHCADNIADEPEFAGRRAHELDQWEDQLDSIYYRKAQANPVFAALANTIEEFDLPITHFKALLSGFRNDLETRRYPTYRSLRDYTARVAEPLGALFLYLGGYRDPLLVRCAEELATAIAFANFWQDLGADVDRGRLYVPEEDLHFFGVTEGDLRMKSTSRRLSDLVSFEVSRTRSLLARARPLVSEIGDDLAAELAIAWHGIDRILEKIDATGCRILTTRPMLGHADKALIVSRAVRWRGKSLAHRAEVRLGGIFRR